MPDVAMHDQNGKTVRIRDFRGKKVVLYFYPRDNTPGCTREACDFRDNLRRLVSKNVVVLGVSPDDAESHKRFADKHDLTFPLLVDEKAELAKRLSVWGKKNMYGRSFQGIIRSTFLIDEDGRIIKEYRHVRVNGHVKELIHALESA